MATGASPGAQTVEAFNVGDGALSLTLSSSATWITPTVGAARTCRYTTAASSCLPLQFALNTAALTAGTYTGIVTVSDANALDAPQTITITVRVGGIDAFVAPGSTREIGFTTSSLANVRATTQDSGQWLAVALDGTGSFRFEYPYKVRLQPAAGMASGNYTGSVITSGASTAADNQTIPVTMRVTTQSIAQATPDRISVTLAEGAPALAYPFAPSITVEDISPAGTMSVGTLAIREATPAGQTWFKAEFVPAASGSVKGLVVLTFDPKGLAPGTQTVSLTINSNAANSALTVPVELRIVPKGAPTVSAALDNATFIPFDTVTPGDVMVVKGDQLSFEEFKSGGTPPLATTLGGARVLVNGTAAPIFYSAYGQIAFQMPVETPLGQATIQVERDGTQLSNKVSADVRARAPRLLRIGVQDYGAVVNATDSSFPMPVGSLPGANTHPAKPGDVLVLYAIGLGPTDPVVPTGAPAPSVEPYAPLAMPIQVNFGGGLLGAIATPFYAGLTPTYAGLYQINVVIPDESPKGIIALTAAFPDFVSNTIMIAVQ